MSTTPATFDFTASFQRTVAKFEGLSAGKKADYKRASKSSISAHDQVQLNSKANVIKE